MIVATRSTSSPRRSTAEITERMKKNALKAALRRGESQIGTWLSLSSALSTRFMARTGFPWLTVDIEHSPVNWETAAHMFAQIADAGCVPLARVPSNSHENIKRVLDNGAYGIVVPMVNTAEEACRAVAATRYHPEGDRSVGGNLHALAFGTNPSEYYARANREIFVAVQTEHIRAVENADEICAVEGLDAIFIGPNDLLQSMGKTPAMETDDPEFVDALRILREAADRHGIAPGLHTGSVDSALRRRREGWRFIALGSDLMFLTQGAMHAVEELGMKEKTETHRY